MPYTKEMAEKQFSIKNTLQKMSPMWQEGACLVI